MQQEPSQAELWNNIADSWRIQEETSRPMYEAIINTLDFTTPKSVLDVGCGTGFCLSLMAAHGAEVTGVDISDTQLKIAKQYQPSATFIVAGLEVLPFADKSFDYVVANNAVQYSSDADKGLAEIYRVLKPGGKAVITLWDEIHKSEAISYFQVFYKITNQAMETSRPFNLSKRGLIDELLLKAGFSVQGAQSIICPLIFPDADITLKAIMACGPANNAIRVSSEEAVTQQVAAAIKPYLQPDGSYRINNSFVFTTAVKG